MVVNIYFLILGPVEDSPFLFIQSGCAAIDNQNTTNGF